MSSSPSPSPSLRSTIQCCRLISETQQSRAASNMMWWYSWGSISTVLWPKLARWATVGQLTTQTSVYNEECTIKFGPVRRSTTTFPLPGPMLWRKTRPRRTLTTSSRMTRSLNRSETPIQLTYRPEIVKQWSQGICRPVFLAATRLPAARHSHTLRRLQFPSICSMKMPCTHVDSCFQSANLLKAVHLVASPWDYRCLAPALWYWCTPCIIA